MFLGAMGHTSWSGMSWPRRPLDGSGITGLGLSPNPSDSNVHCAQAALALYRMCGFEEVQEVASQTSSVGSKLGGHAPASQCCGSLPFTLGLPHHLEA